MAISFSTEPRASPKTRRQITRWSTPLTDRRLSSKRRPTGGASLSGRGAIAAVYHLGLRNPSAGSSTIAFVPTGDDCSLRLALSPYFKGRYLSKDEMPPASGRGAPSGKPRPLSLTGQTILEAGTPLSLTIFPPPLIFPP